MLNYLIIEIFLTVGLWTLLLSISKVIYSGLLDSMITRPSKTFLSPLKFVMAIFTMSLLFYYFTGPRNLANYPPSQSSPYSLPWKSPVSHWVSQGNRSFTTHRGFYEYSWDFWMPIGTPILAARSGKVVEVVSHLDGIGFFHGNRIVIEHEDKTKAVYAHIQKNGAVVKPGKFVRQGQHIGYSGMVGATINPHLHFHVLDRDGSKTIPITFREVDGGIPLAGQFYISANQPKPRRPIW